VNNDVLDVSALVALIANEEGGEKVAKHLAKCLQSIKSKKTF
jgi:PIN domain nuclease of toxin-antitoxin system